MSTTIELNGKLYDAKSGKPIAQKKEPARGAASRPSSSGFIDGVRRPLGQAAQTVKRPIAQVKAAVVPKKSHTKAKSAQKVHSRTQRTATLLRRGLTKPATKGATTQTAAKDSKPTSRPSEERAKLIPRSEKITRFATSTKHVITHSQPVKQVLDVNSTTHTQKSVPTKSHKPTKTVSTKEKLIAEGLAKSQSHNEPKHEKPKRRKIWKKLLPIASVVIIVSYIAYLNIPNVAMKVAAMKAGFSANLPSYNPGGFRMSGPVAYSPGQITIGYRSNTDDRQYQITQKKSNWDSESLLTNYVTDKPDYQTYRDHGLTIYVFDASNATWVNSGVWYTIEGKSQLSAQQIVKIAASM